ncbi:LD-carboxypeptidase, partial [Kingella kingae]|nr:LD-carboxypeptidase [Kingella kingae]
MKMKLSRRHLLQHSALAMSSGILAACGSLPKPTPSVTPTANTMPSTQPNRPNTSSNQSSLHLFASSGFCEDPTRIQNGLNALHGAGFV